MVVLLLLQVVNLGGEKGVLLPQFLQRGADGVYLGRCLPTARYDGSRRALPRKPFGWRSGWAASVVTVAGRGVPLPFPGRGVWMGTGRWRPHTAVV